MDVLKRNVFWLALAGVLIAALVAYLVLVMPVRSQAAGLATQIAEFEAQFKNWAKQPEKFVFSDAQIAQVSTYKRELNAMIGKVKGGLLQRQFDLEKAEFDPAPPRDPVDFRVWLQAQYAQRNRMLDDKGILRLGRNAPERGDYPVDIQSVPPEEREIALRRFYITREVYEGIATCSFTENVLVRDEENPEKEVPKQVERHVNAINRFVFMAPEEMATGRGKIAAGGSRPAATIARPPSLTPGKPYKEHLFELEILCHFSLVPQLLQKLDGTEDFMLVIKRVDIMPVRPSRQQEGSAGEYDKMLVNSRDGEAPVAVLLECAVLEFVFEDAAAKGGR